MGKVNGSTILFKIATKLISGQTSGSFQSAMDMIETTTKQSTNGAKEFIGGELNRTFSASGCFDPESTDWGFLDAITAQAARTPIAFVYGGVVAGDDIISGNCLISNISKDDPQNDRSTFSLDFQVTGDITQAVVSI